MTHEKLRELLAPYALGILEAQELQELKQHLATGCHECGAELRVYESAAAALAYSAPPVEPPAALRDRILRTAAERAENPVQIWKSWPDDAPANAMSVVRAGEGDWQDTGAPGVSVKKLSYDADRRMTTMLIRMLAGSSYPRHRHSLAEECYVIEGDLHVGDLVMHAGDFQRAEAQSLHVEQFTESGCLLLITSSLEDEILA